ncbi:MAG: hypothetical protein FIB06_00270 [Betaproteobacteria bacterium]|nr:hypothetical protein [Betaproteobacteria bacterium]
MPLHYYGLVHTLVCRSPATGALPEPARTGTGRGWNFVAQLASRPGQSPSAADREAALAAAIREARDGFARGDGWIAWQGETFRISLDACGHFADFIPWRDLPADSIDAQPRPPQCAPPADCRYLDFAGERRAHFADVRVTPASPEPRIELTLRSSALRGQPLRRLGSDDGGRTWRIADPE